MQLLQEIGHAYLALSQFECSRAVELFEGLAQRHYQTGWVLAQLGKAYFEQDEYKKVSINYHYFGHIVCSHAPK